MKPHWSICCRQVPFWLIGARLTKYSVLLKMRYRYARWFFISMKNYRTIVLNVIYVNFYLGSLLYLINSKLWQWFSVGFSVWFWLKNLVKVNDALVVGLSILNLTAAKQSSVHSVERIDCVLHYIGAGAGCTRFFQAWHSAHRTESVRACSRGHARLFNWRLKLPDIQLSYW